MGSVRVGLWNDLSNLREDELKLYAVERWRTMQQLVREGNRHEAKRALHQVIDAIQEAERRGYEWETLILD